MAVLALHGRIHVPAGLIDVQVRGGGVALTDRRRERGQQVRTRRKHPGQGAVGDIKPVVGQRGDDPVHRAAQHELLHQQPGQKPSAEPALADRLGNRRGDQHPADRATTGAPIRRAAVHNPDQRNLPVDLLAALFPERGVARAAARAHPLALGNVVDLLAGREMGVVPATVPTRAPPLPAAALRLPAGRVAGLRVAGVFADRRRLGLLRRLPERQPRQHRHLLGERADLALQVRDPGPQHDVVRSQALRLGPPELLTAPSTEIAVAHDTSTRSPPRIGVQHPSPHGVSLNRPRAPAGLRDHRMLTPVLHHPGAQHHPQELEHGLVTHAFELPPLGRSPRYL